MQKWEDVGEAEEECKLLGTCFSRQRHICRQKSSACLLANFSSGKKH